jgi:hypothetical protein
MKILRLMVVLIFGLAQFTFAIPAFAKGSNHALKVIALVEQQQVFGGGGGGGRGCSSAGGITTQAECGGGGGGSSCPVDLDYDGHCDYLYRTEAFGSFQYAERGSIIWASEWKYCSSNNAQNGKCTITFNEVNGKEVSFGAEFGGEYGLIPDILTIVGAVSGSYTKTFVLEANLTAYPNIGYGARYTANKVIQYYSGQYKNYYQDYNTPSTGSKIGSVWWYKKPHGVIGDTNIQRFY